MDDALDGEVAGAQSEAGETTAGEALPTVRLSLHSASVLAAATGAVGALDTAVASVLLGDPFRVGLGGHAAELERLRLAGIWAIKAAEVASDSDEEVDLDLVAEAALEAVRGVLWLAVCCLEMARRGDVGPSAERQVESLQETVEAIAALLPGAKRC